jgi:hypothetical protein
LIDWNNYEANMPYFQTRFRRSVDFPDLVGFVKAPRSLRVRKNRHVIDAIYTWKMPPQDPLRERLAKHYERVSSRFGGELWQRPADGGGMESPPTRPPRRKKG